MNANLDDSVGQKKGPVGTSIGSCEFCAIGFSGRHGGRRTKLPSRSQRGGKTSSEVAVGRVGVLSIPLDRFFYARSISSGHTELVEVC